MNGFLKAYVGVVMAHIQSKESIEVALRPLPAGRLPSQVVVEPEQMSGILVRMPEGSGLARLAAIYGLAFLILLGLGARISGTGFNFLAAYPGWVLLIIAVLCLGGSLFAGFQTWRLRPGTATVAYGWSGLAKLGFKRVLVDVISVEYVLEAWDNGAGAWHRVNLVTSGRDPYVIVTRTSKWAVRNQLPISSSADLNLIPEIAALGHLFAEALAVPSRVETSVVRSPEPWWSGD